ncbi:MAG: anion permease, partial [Thermoanaerobaculales bacterium]|nr:anion permease [Thermoanaerobaculales bacterium]
MAAVESSVRPRRYFTFRRKKRYDIDWRRVFFLSLGVALFFAVFMSPPWPAAIDPMGDAFELSNQGKAALGLFLLAAVWWVFEVVPIGVTSITIGVVQALFLIRPDIMLAGSQTTVGGAELAFKEFMHPSVWFIFGSIVIGMVFTKTGLTKRLAYKMLVLVGEKTSRIYLGCFIMTAALTLVMAHTAVAATVFPLLVAIYRLYNEGDEPTRFGKGLFIGMAYVAGAGSIITLLGAARGAVALGFYKEITGQDITFFGLTWYMFPVGWTMVFVLWAFFMVYYKPERATIPGLRQRARDLYTHLGPITTKEIQAAVIVITAVSIMSLRSFIPALKGLDKSGIILLATVLFFVLKILDIGDLEDV